MIYSFEQVVKKKDGFLRGPFGSALKKSLFVPKGKDTIKVYEQSVPLEQDETLGNYYISREYFVNSMFRFEVKPNDFLISCSGVNYGAIYQLSNNAEHGVINQALLRVRLNNDVIDDNYFLYLFKSLIMKKITSGTGDSTIPNFPSMDIVKKIEFDLPELIRQKKVGFILSSIDKKIVNNNKINAKLESMAKTLYDYWFLQFDFPNEEGKPYKSSGGKMVWNEELKREIPENWENSTLSKVSNMYQPKTFDAKLLDDSGIFRVYGAGGYMGQYNKFNHAQSEVFISCRGSCGNVYKSMPFSLITGNAMIVQSADERLFNYLYLTLLRIGVKNCITGSVQPQITRDSLNDWKLVVPNAELIVKFNQIISPLLKKQEEIINENQELTSLRDFLLPLLMNGQVTFKS